MSTYKKYTQKLNFFEQLIHSNYSDLFLLWLVMNIAFTAAYFTLSLTHPSHGLNFPADMKMWVRLYDSFYFSVATTTTLGYGDIIPLGISKMFAILQASAGLMVFTVLVGKLVSKGQGIKK